MVWMWAVPGVWITLCPHWFTQESKFNVRSNWNWRRLSWFTLTILHLKSSKKSSARNQNSKMVIKATRKHQIAFFHKVSEGYSVWSKQTRHSRFLWRLEATGYFTCVINPKKKSQGHPFWLWWLAQEKASSSQKWLYILIWTKHHQLLHQRKGKTYTWAYSTDGWVCWCTVCIHWFDQPDLWRG